MLPKEHRLKKEKDFELLFKKGRGVFDNFVGIKFLDNNLSISRFGFVVGVKVSKKAVKRNLVKRRLREVTKNKLKEIKPGFDIILIIRPAALGLNLDELEEKTVKSLKKAHLL